MICKDLVSRVGRKQEFDQRTFSTGFQIDKYHEQIFKNTFSAEYLQSFTY